MRFSILIPAHDEEKHIANCLESIRVASRPYPDDVQVIVSLNRCTDRTEAIARSYNAEIAREDRRCIAAVRNAAARLARGDILVTIDADSAMSPNMLSEIDRRLSSGRYVGGGVAVRPERWSLGIFCTGLILLPIMLYHRVSGGLFWCWRKDFEAIGGFDESFVSVEDLDFARRLKAHGRRQGKRFGTILRAHIRTSCRKFDRFGDWYLVKNPGLLRTIFTGKDQQAADHFYYDFKR